ncbi:MAG: hypothetical protein RI995_1673 [Bacteroidota bacterium]|jgi:hypothetical protein
MKNKSIVALFVLLSISLIGFSQQKEWGSGLRIGEPGGFMIRKYLKNGINAIEVNMGTYGGLWGTHRNYKAGTFQNIGYSVNVMYLWHHPTILNPNIQTYYGVGPQYTVRDYYAPGQEIANEVRKALGGSVIGGVEYFPIDAPNLSFFSELGFYSEISPNPFFTHVQGGVGVRVNF